MVMQNSVMKYMTRIGQKTGMLKNSKKVQKKAMAVAFVAEYQNLNSGNRLRRKELAFSYKTTGHIWSVKHDYVIIYLVTFLT